MRLERATSVGKATPRCTSVDGSTRRVHLPNQTSRDPQRRCSFSEKQAHAKPISGAGGDSSIVGNSIVNFVGDIEIASLFSPYL
jgi:hypothetical protein